MKSIDTSEEDQICQVSYSRYDHTCLCCLWDCRTNISKTKTYV